MSKDNHIKTFTAIDIEKYHQGKLSPREMHDLEKAALDDPFLADALEGYQAAGVNAIADIADLKKRLADRVEKDDAIPMAAAGSPSGFRWWKAVAMIILVAGAGLLVYQFGFTNNKDIAVAKVEAPVRDNTVAPKADSSYASYRALPDSASMSAMNTHTGRLGSSNYTISSDALFDTLKMTTDTVSVLKGDDDVVINAGIGTFSPSEKQEENKQLKPVTPPVPQYKSNTLSKPNNFSQPVIVAQSGYEKKSSGIAYYDYSKDSLVAKDAKNKTVQFGATDNRFLSMQQNQVRRNVFRGQVTDNNFNALPFANITNIADNVGTYTDAKGNFVLTSTDSILNVQVKSIGFDNNITQLTPLPAPSQVILQEDRKSLSEVVISRKKITSKRSRNSSMVLEEPEPVDGWENYDTYVANNLVVPETYKMKESEGAGLVELSFDVNKNGEPVNITVDKSLCESCDKEAIRLIKEGPKWKRKAKKKGRTSVTISF